MNCHKGKQQLLDSAKSCSASDIGARNSGCLVSLREKDRCGKHRVIAVLAAVLCLVSGLTACSEQTEELTPEAYNARLDTLSGKNISVPAIVCEKYSNMIVFGIKSVIYDETEVQVINYLYIPPELFETQVGVGDHVLLTGELGVDDSGAQTLLHPEVSKEAASEQEEIDCAAFTGTYTDSANLVVTLKEDAQQLHYEVLCVSSGDYIASIEGETALAGSREIPFYGNDGWDNVVEGTIYLMEDGNVTLESRYVSENPMAMWGLSVESCVLPKYDQWLPDGQLPPLSGMSWESEETAQDVPEAYITLDAIFDNMARAKAYYSDTYVYVQDAKILSIYDDYLAVTSDTGFDWLDAKFTNPEELYQLHEGQYICFTGTCKFDDAWNIFSFEDCVLQAWS